MDIAIVRTFLAAAATGSFAAAARRVNASPSAVTERIKQLEHQLRVRLFERDKRGCRLTPAGRRFLAPAENMVRAWNQGCAKVALPSRFSQVIRVGGQHALWPSLLIPWLQELRDNLDDHAIRAVAAAPAQLNRALEEDELDIAFLYDPLLRRGVRIDELVSDRLVLVTARPDIPWEENFVRIDWGENAGAELTARLGDLPGPGFELDLGILSLDWLIETGSCGYAPERLAAKHLRAGALHRVAGMPTIGFAPFVCWRNTLDRELAGRMIDMARRRMGNLLE